MGMEPSILRVYQAEVVPTRARGLTVSTYQFSIQVRDQYHVSTLQLVVDCISQIGALIMNLVALGTSTIPENRSWPIPFGLFYVDPAIVIAGLHWVPKVRWS